VKSLGWLAIAHSNIATPTETAVSASVGTKLSAPATSIGGDGHYIKTRHGVRFSAGGALPQPQPHLVPPAGRYLLDTLRRSLAAARMQRSNQARNVASSKTPQPLQRFVKDLSAFKILLAAVRNMRSAHWIGFGSTS
jgi:hypothetical protein